MHIAFPPRIAGFWSPLRRNRASLTIVLAVTLLAAVLLPTSVSAGGYSALAYSKTTHRWGESHGRISRADAERRALAACNSRGAFVAGWGYNNYIALATGSGSAWGFGFGRTRKIAESHALRACPARDARIVRYAYSFE